MKKIKNTEYVQVNFSSSDTKLRFNTIPNISGKNIISIIALNAAQLTGTPDAKTVMSEADFKKCAIVLVPKGSNQEAITMPLYLLNPAYSNGEVKEFDFGQLDETKSYIIASATVSASSLPLYIIAE